MVRCLLVASAVVVLGGCHHTVGNDEGSRYVQRKDTVTFSAGDAKQVNMIAHIRTPWPRGVEDPFIFANGERMVERAIEPYLSGGSSGSVLVNGGNGDNVVPTFGQRAPGTATAAR